MRNNFQPEDIGALPYVIMAQRRGLPEQTRARYATLEEAENKLKQLNDKKNPWIHFWIKTND
jgi:hypothetical protein